jgi:hypothetical protein
MNNPTNIGIQLNIFLHEVKAIFTQLINQNSVVTVVCTSLMNVMNGEVNQTQALAPN